jgi:hypothetical protein
MPTGGGDDENGNLDVRMEEAILKAKASKQKQTDLLKRKFGSNYGSIMEIVQYWISLFPLAIAGVGIMSEKAMQSGAGRKRESLICNNKFCNGQCSLCQEVFAWMRMSLPKYARKYENEFQIKCVNVNTL